MTQTAKEKAKQLVDKCYYQIEDATAGMFEEGVDYVKARSIAAKQCALIACEELLYNIEVPTENYKYWQEVKTEIQNL